MRILLLISVLVAITVNFVNTQQQEVNPSLDAEWVEFKNKYKRTYASVAEEFSRYLKTFQNDIYIEKNFIFITIDA
jgi:hypothetical protein